MGVKTKIAAISGAALSSAFLALAQVPPVPIPGGDVIAPGFQIHQFLPGTETALGFDGLNAELNGITNFRGLSALAYTSGTATDNTGRIYNAQTDIRLYVGEYVAADGTHARGVFVEIWIDLFDPSSGSQLHDFNPGILPDGLFWMVQVPEDAVEIRGNTVTVKLKNVPVVDNITFFPISGNVPALTSFEMSYTRSGTPRSVQPASTDPTSPFNWAGEMWQATGSVTFSVVYRDGSFAVHGNAVSSGTGVFFGELGTERNGFFLTQWGGEVARRSLS